MNLDHFFDQYYKLNDGLSLVNILLKLIALHLDQYFLQLQIENAVDCSISPPLRWPHYGPRICC